MALIIDKLPYRRWFNNERFSDVTIRCVGDDWTMDFKCHKVVLCTHSAFFDQHYEAQAINTGDAPEVITLCDRPLLLRAVLYEIYDIDYSTDQTYGWTRWRFHHEVVRTAKKVFDDHESRGSEH